MTTEKTRQKIIEGFMGLAADQPFDTVTMPAIADAAKVKLETLRAAYDTRLAILEDLARRTDIAVLRARDPGLHEEGIRDRFFEVLMLRFEALTPYKRGLKAIGRRARRDPVLAAALFRIVFQSQGWMVNAVGLGTSGVAGAVRTQAVMAAYLEAQAVWFEDDAPGLARTMAALDKALRKAERRLKGLGRIGRLFTSGRSSGGVGRGAPTPDADTERADGAGGH